MGIIDLGNWKVRPLFEVLHPVLKFHIWLDPTLVTALLFLDLGSQFFLVTSLFFHACHNSFLLVVVWSAVLRFMVSSWVKTSPPTSLFFKIALEVLEIQVPQIHLQVIHSPDGLSAYLLPSTAKSQMGHCDSRNDHYQSYPFWAQPCCCDESQNILVLTENSVGFICDSQWGHDQL